MKRRLLVALLTLAACSKSNSATPDAPIAIVIDAAPLPPDSNLAMVTFSYTPSWAGATSVAVIGGFGEANDWTTPFLTLTASGGTFTGTATLAPGSYDYLFAVVGDSDAGAKSATYPHVALDPAQSAFEPCPASAPMSAEMNPCSKLVVPVTAGAPTLFHVRGSIVDGTAAAASYLVVLERDEPTSHHAFVNRVTTGADGTYDLVAAAGNYRIQVQHPQYESKTDQQLAPATLGIVRRNISSAFPVAADVTLSAAQVAFGDYASFAPQTTGTPLPTTFTFGTSSGLATRLDVYGTANAGSAAEIGDPWFTAAATTSGSAAFDGTFNTAKATETAVATGERYFWGVEQPHPADAAGVVWTDQSMVVPVTWH